MDDYNTKKVTFIYHDELKLKSQVKENLQRIPEAQQKLPNALLLKIVQDFINVENLLSFKDAFKRLRKLIKEHPSLLDHEDLQPIILDLILALCKEAFFGPLKDLKGLLYDLIEGFAKNEYYAEQIRDLFEKDCLKFLETAIKSSEEEEERMKNPKWELNIEKIDDTIKYMNNFGDLLFILGKDMESLVRPYMRLHTKNLKQLTTSFENNKHIAVKLLQVLAEEMRNCISVVTNFKDEILYRVAEDDLELKVDLMILSLSCRIYLCAINRINHETASQCSILAVYIDCVILKVADNEFEGFHLVENEIHSPFTPKTYSQTDDVLKMRRLSIIRSLIIYKENFDIFQSFKTLHETPYSLVISGCLEPNTNLRHYSFKTLSVVLDAIEKDENTRQKFFNKRNLHTELFELLLKNWESPVKGITHQIEEVLKSLIRILATQEPKKRDLAVKDIKDKLLSLNVSHSKKKYNALVILLEYLDVEKLLQENDTLIYELLVSSGDIHLASSAILLEKILIRIDKNLSENKSLAKDQRFFKWTQYWIDDFMICLEKEEFNVIRGIMIHITPMLCNINVATTGYLIDLLMRKDLSKKNFLWCYVSLLKSARANNLLEYAQNQNGYKFKENIGGLNLYLPNIEVDFTRKLLLNTNRNIMLSMLELITTSPKPAEIPAVFEYSLISDFLKYNLRTSYSDFRNNITTVLKKFFVRLRVIYENNLIKHFPLNKTNVSERDLENLGPKEAKANFKAMVDFLKQIFHALNQDLRPEAEHEIIFPIMEVNKLIFQFFGLEDYTYKKTMTFKGTSLLYYIDAFNSNFFHYLLLSLKCSWDLVRFSAQEILLGFPENYSHLTTDSLHHELIPSAVDLTKNPVIKNAEGGALLLALIDRKFAHKIDFSRLEFNTEVHQVPSNLIPSLKFAYFILGLLEKRFQNLQKYFLEDQTEYANNLIHGLITCLGFLVQELPKSQELKKKENKEDFRNFFHDLSETLARVLSYATKLSADNISTCILDNNATVKKLNNEIQVNKIATDCRGHIISDKPEDPTILAKLKNIENLLYGNTLMEGMEENNEFDVENIIVVSFYLITRESGLLFQNISNLILSLDETSNVIDHTDLQLLVDTYFHALLNVKHLGSIDRIAHGLSILCKSMYETKNPILPNLAEELTDQILNALEQGDFKNILRRSAGIPPAIICLLKSEPYGKKSRLFPKVMKKLFEYTEKGKTNEIKVHALNILKFIFQDSNLRADIESYIGQGYVSAIKGFSSSDWVIRNSALMLFSSIAKRTIGTEKVADQQSIRNSINIVEFFTRAPQLVDFFLQEVQNYVHSEVQQRSLYPSLYPIALIMSRLLPYDLKNNYLRKAIESEDQENQIVQNEEDIREHKKFVTMEELRKFLPLFVKAAHNKNYMGRLMCARAVLPFIPYETIIDHVIELLDLNNLREISILKSDHNFAHGLLLQIYYIIKNHYKLQESYPHETNRFRQNLPALIDKLSERRFIMIYVKCAFIPTVYLQIMKKLLKSIGNDEAFAIKEIFAYIYGYCLQMFKEECKLETFRVTRDFGVSILRLKYLQYALIYDRVVNKSLDSYKDLLQIFVEKYRSNLIQRKKDDNEPFHVLLKYWNKYLKFVGQATMTNQEKEFVLSNLCNLLAEPEFSCMEFLPCVSEILAIILNMNCREVVHSEQISLLLNCLDTLFRKFPQNSRLMKNLIKLYGDLLSVYLSRNQKGEGNFLASYQAICEKFSYSGQIDLLRIAVIKSLKLSLKPIMDNVQDFESFLNFSKIIIRLLQDEIPEIRSKIADFVSRIFKIEADSKFQFKFNPNYILESYFHFILQRYEAWKADHQSKNRVALNQFILSYVFESEFDNYMELAHYEKRIFTIEKPNKFYSDFAVKRIAYHVYLKMIDKRIISHYDLQTFLDSQKYKFKDVSERNIDKYLNETFIRDEFLFGCILKRLYQDCLFKKTEATESDFYVKLKKNKHLLEPYLRTLIETSS